VRKGSEKSDEAVDWDTSGGRELANTAKIDRESLSDVTLENCCRQIKLTFPCTVAYFSDGQTFLGAGPKKIFWRAIMIIIKLNKDSKNIILKILLSKSCFCF